MSEGAFVKTASTTGHQKKNESTKEIHCMNVFRSSIDKKVSFRDGKIHHFNEFSVCYVKLGM